MFQVAEGAILRSDWFAEQCLSRAGHAGVGGYLRAELRLRRASRETAPLEVLVLGSSIAREDVDEEELGERLGGKTAHSLALDSGHPLDISVMADRILDARPRSVVYLPHISAFYGSYDFAKTRYWFSSSLVMRLIRAIGPSVLISERDMFFRGFLGRLSFLYRYNAELSAFLEEALLEAKARIEGREPSRPVLRRFLYEKDEPEDVLRQRAEEYRRTSYVNSRLTSAQKEAFEDLAVRLHGAGIRLVVVDAPAHPLVSAFVPTPIGADYQAYLAGSAERLGYEYIPHAAQPHFTSREFVDFFHLNALGRARFTAFMASVLRPSTN